MKKKTLILFCALVALGLLKNARAQVAIPDSVDVLHYDLTLDMGHNVEKQLQGVAEITFVKTRDCGQVTFDLIADSIQPVWLDGTVTRGFSFDRDNRLVTVYVGGQPGDTHVVRISYFSHGYVENYGFGGLHMDNSLYYNLGAVFMEYPHCFGRSLYPCRDNFHDKATYTYRVTSQPGWRSLCSGQLASASTLPDGGLLEVWELSQPSPTYISSVSSAPWHVIETTYQGLDTVYPAILGFSNHDSSHVVQHFAMLDSVVPMFERCFGPYRWGRIGYIATPMGSMEHAQNIALVSQCMADVSSLSCEMTTCHELAHAWFGNLITCATEGDMWINEGGASFCEEVANEAIHGKASSINYYQENLRDVILSAHLSDGGYRALHNMPERYTYGSTTYDKGALVWHSLRGQMGDSLFYASMRRLFNSCAFGNLDADALRDSLSLYSGLDLTGFFDFHVFHPGFVDYEMEMGVNGYDRLLRFRQLLRGTDHYATGCKVPVTFFSLDGQSRKEWFTVNDSLSEHWVTLPFMASHAIVDFDHELSDACTDGYTPLKAQGARDLSLAYCKVSTSAASGWTNAWVHVGHHYVAPSGPMPEGVQRVAGRYWQVTGQIPRDVTVYGLFNYNSSSQLDADLFLGRGTLDSLYLFYRPTPHHPWQCVTNDRTSSSTSSSGYLRTPFLQDGQYTLAVVDTALLADTAWASISPLNSPSFRARPGISTLNFQLSPNPAGQDFRVEMGDYDKKINLIMYDSAGRKVLEMRDINNGDRVCHHLPAGTYIVLIQNKFLSLQSQIVIQ